MKPTSLYWEIIGFILKRIYKKKQHKEKSKVQILMFFFSYPSYNEKTQIAKFQWFLIKH